MTEGPHQESGTEFTQGGTSWGASAAEKYASTRHGPDGAIFLDPYFIPPLLDNIDDMLVADIGCGACPWAIEAVRNGAARVEALDIQSAMVEQGEQAVAAVGLSDKIGIQVGNATHLPYESNSIDRAMSINVGCNMDVPTLAQHLLELHRVLKDGASAIITAPASFGEVFLSGSADESQLLSKLKASVEDVGYRTRLEVGRNTLGNYDEIYRATFAFREDRLVLITDEDDLIPGEEIWRKLPGLLGPEPLSFGE